MGFVQKVIDDCHQVEDTYAYRLTPFLNPQEEKIVQTIAAHFGLLTYSSRDFLATETCRVIIAPDYYVLEVADFEMSLLEILYPRKFHQLSHAQVLGTLLNRLGIQRPYLGDILVGAEELFLILDRRFADLARLEIDKIARVPVTWKERDMLTTSLPQPLAGTIKQILVSSLRLDKLVSVAFHVPRPQVVKLIETGQVKIDYREITQVSKEVAVGSLISARGLGRMRFLDLLGMTKQNKYKIIIEQMKK